MKMQLTIILNCSVIVVVAQNVHDIHTNPLFYVLFSINQWWNVQQIPLQFVIRCQDSLYVFIMCTKASVSNKSQSPLFLILMHQRPKQKISRPICQSALLTEKTNEWDKVFQGLTFTIMSVNNMRNMSFEVENY